MNKEQFTLNWPINETVAEEDFLPSDSNQYAVKWIDSWPAWQRGGDDFHCLIIYGPSGCGKTHLSHVWQKMSAAELVDIEKLSEIDFILAENFVFIIENVDDHILNSKIVESLFHLYNWVKEQGGYLLLTAKRHPKNWNIGLEDLSSRMLASEAVEIKPPDDKLLQAIIIKQFSDRQVTLPKEVLKYLIPRVERSFESLAKLVHDIDQLSLAEKKKITIPMVKRVLEKDE